MDVSLEEVGKVLTVGDGIARIYGLNNAQSGELVEFETGEQGIVQNLEEDNVGVVMLAESNTINEGDTVKRTKRIASVKVGEQLVGRVINTIGEPIDGKGPIAQGSGRHLPSACGAAAPDGYQGYRLDDSHRPRPARAHYRRPPDG